MNMPASYYPGQYQQWQMPVLQKLYPWLFATDIEPTSGEQFYRSSYYSDLGDPASLLGLAAKGGRMPEMFEPGLQGLLSENYFKRLQGAMGGDVGGNIQRRWREQVLDYILRPETLLQTLTSTFPAMAGMGRIPEDRGNIYQMLSMLIGGA